jgi:predicted acetylornithine/succinylornithine family transaminase
MNTTMETATLDSIRKQEASLLIPTYERVPLLITRGEGVNLYDSEGRAYLDFLSGIGVNALGHAHPRICAAILAQMRLIHVSNLFFHEYQAPLAARLTALSGLDRAFFCNSGTEAVEACLKFARRYWFTKGEARQEFVALDESFHGRTFGSLSVTSDEHYRTPFEPLLPSVKFIRTNDVASLKAAVSSKTAAIIAEPVLGEGGIRPLTPAFAAAITEVCSKTGALFIADEVQSGVGRTGYPFYFKALGLHPHLVSVGKALGSGVPIGAALVSQEVADAISFGDHGTTYGGNLLACRAALVVLDELVGGGLLAQIGRVGKQFEGHLRAIAAKHPIVREVRGAGLMWGLELTRDAGAVVPAGLERGVVVNRTADTVVRLLPPLVISETEADEALDRLDAALAAVGAAE